MAVWHVPIGSKIFSKSVQEFLKFLIPMYNVESCPVPYIVECRHLNFDG